jgi:hypothetical protein
MALEVAGTRRRSVKKKLSLLLVPKLFIRFLLF